jgi:hypothetical protein
MHTHQARALQLLTRLDSGTRVRAIYLNSFFSALKNKSIIYQVVNSLMRAPTTADSTTAG